MHELEVVPLEPLVLVAAAPLEVEAVPEVEPVDAVELAAAVEEVGDDEPEEFEPVPEAPVPVAPTDVCTNPVVPKVVPLLLPTFAATGLQPTINTTARAEHARQRIMGTSGQRACPARPGIF